MYIRDPVSVRSVFDVDVSGQFRRASVISIVFDPSWQGPVLAGPASFPPHELTVEVRDDSVFVSG